MGAPVRDKCQLRAYKANRLDKKRKETNSELPERNAGTIE